MKKLAILGSTGSIGTQTLQVVDEFPQLFSVEILAANHNWQLVGEQARKYKPKFVVLNNKSAYEHLAGEWRDENIKLLYGMENLLKILGETSLDMVVGAMGGAIGIAPTLRALELGIDVALANKETIVAGGDLVRLAQEKSGAKILPVDSEHSAIFQCMEHAHGAFSKILLTASGGPFREFTKEELYRVKPAQALKHPNWTMGRKITIDSATLMNKGLEIIEARWLFNVDYDNIRVLVHPQSVVHSLVEFGDGAIIGHLGAADMRIPIQYALTYPERMPNSFPKIDLAKLSGLTFHDPDREKFPCLDLAVTAGKTGGSLPTVMNAANEIAVQAFLDEQIGFMDIPALVEKVMQKHTSVPIESFEQLLAIDRESRIISENLVKAKH